MRRDLRPLALVTQVGLTMMVCILSGLAIGLWVDNTFGTKPWVTLLLTVVGVTAGTYSIYRVVSEVIDEAVGHSHQGSINGEKDEGEKGG